MHNSIHGGFSENKCDSGKVTLVPFNKNLGHVIIPQVNDIVSGVKGILNKHWVVMEEEYEKDDSLVYGTAVYFFK